MLADVLLALWRRLDDVPADASLPYAYGVARRCLADSRRSAGRQDRVVARLARQRLRDDGDPDDLLDGFLLDGRKSGDPTGQTGTSRKGGGGR